jgi:hypothetical protein
MSSSTVQMIIVEKNAKLKELFVERNDSEELYKKAGFKTSANFKLQHTFIFTLNDVSSEIMIYGKNEGKNGQENKYEFPPPIDNLLLFGSCLLIKTTNGNIVNLTIPDWKNIYNNLYGGFDDLKDTEEEDELEEEILILNDPNVQLSKEGYVLDDFVVEDDDDDDDEETTERLNVTHNKPDKKKKSSKDKTPKDKNKKKTSITPAVQITEPVVVLKDDDESVENKQTEIQTLTKTKNQKKTRQNKKQKEHVVMDTENIEESPNNAVVDSEEENMNPPTPPPCSDIKIKKSKTTKNKKNVENTNIKEDTGVVVAVEPSIVTNNNIDIITNDENAPHKVEKKEKSTKHTKSKKTKDIGSIVQDTEEEDITVLTDKTQKRPKTVKPKKEKKQGIDVDETTKLNNDDDIGGIVKKSKTTKPKKNETDISTDKNKTTALKSKKNKKTIEPENEEGTHATDEKYFNCSNELVEEEFV